MSTVLLTGATGNLGGLVLPRLLKAGHEVRAFSRRPQAPPDAAMSIGVPTFTGDLVDGTGLRVALEGVDTVLHCASDPRHPDADVTSIRTLLEARRATGADVHLLYVSIVGVDAIPLSYYRAKHRVEQEIAAAGGSWTVQRATQFHAFVETMLAPLARSPLLVLPRGFRFQPVATAEVADRLVDQVTRGPAGRVEDFGGPEVLAARDLAAAWLDARGRRRAVLSVPTPGRLSRAFRSGANLCPDGLRGRMTWAAYLLAAGDTPSQRRAPGVAGS